MKKVSYEYGCRALGHSKGEIYVDDNLSNNEIQKQIEDMADFSVNFDVDEGYEPVKEIVYRKKNL